MLTERARGHVLHELGFTVARAGSDLTGTAAVVPEMWVPGTAVLRTSILAIWADTLAGLLAVDVVGPRVPVTLQLDVDLFAPPAGVSHVQATARALKSGGEVFVASVSLAGDDGVAFGTATGVFVVARDPNVRMPDGVDHVDALRESGGPLRVPFAERVGCERRAPGVAALPRRDESLNASGTVNGGLLAVAIEEAALDASPPGSTLVAMAMRYLRPVRVGPAVASATRHGDVCEVTVCDEGRDDALAVVATTRHVSSRP